MATDAPRCFYYHGSPLEVTIVQCGIKFPFKLQVLSTKWNPYFDMTDYKVMYHVETLVVIQNVCMHCACVCSHYFNLLVGWQFFTVVLETSKYLVDSSLDT